MALPSLVLGRIAIASSEGFRDKKKREEGSLDNGEAEITKLAKKNIKTETNAG
jgi:hypothetical protein